MTLTFQPDFQTALHRGLGRALQQLRETQPTEAASIVLAACLRSTAYDAQLDGSRSEYLLEAAALTGLLERLPTELGHALDALVDVDDQHWNAVQLIDLLATLAKRGDAQAAYALQVRYDQADSGTTLRDLLATGLMDALGRSGVVTVLKASLEVWSEESDAEVEDLLHQARKRLGDDEVQRLLADLAMLYPERASQLLGFDRMQTPRPPRSTRGPHPLLSLQEARRIMRQSLETSDDVCPLRLRSAKLTDEARQSLATDLSVETDLRTLRLLLCIFIDGGYDGELQPLLEHAWYPDELISYRAVTALSHVQAAEVRTLALQLLTALTIETVPIRLLFLNFQPGDEALLRSYLAEASTQTDEDTLHVVCSDLRELTKGHPTPELLQLLAETYPQQPCAPCRIRLAEVLLTHQALPTWLQEEAILDSSADLRALVQAI